MTRKAFPLPFEAEKPRPDDVARIGSDLAIWRGVRDGLMGKAYAPVEHHLSSARTIADGLAERLAEAITDPLGDAEHLAKAIGQKAGAQVQLSMLPVVETALALGMDATRLPSVAGRAKPRPRPRRRGAGPRTDMQPGPQEHVPGPDDPPPGDPPEAQGTTWPAGIPPAPYLGDQPPGNYFWVNSQTGQATTSPVGPTLAQQAQGWVNVGPVGWYLQVPPSQVNAVWLSVLQRIGYGPALPGRPWGPGQAPGPGWQPPAWQFPELAPPRAQPLGASYVQGSTGAAPSEPPPPLSLPMSGSVSSSGAVAVTDAGSAAGAPEAQALALAQQCIADPESCRPTHGAPLYGPGLTPAPSPGPPTGSTMPLPPSGAPPGFIGGMPFPQRAQKPPKMGAPGLPGGPGGLIEPFPPEGPQKPIQWVPGPDGSVLPIFSIPPITPGLPPIMGGAPLGVESSPGAGFPVPGSGAVFPMPVQLPTPILPVPPGPPLAGGPGLGLPGPRVPVPPLKTLLPTGGIPPPSPPGGSVGPTGGTPPPGGQLGPLPPGGAAVTPEGGGQPCPPPAIYLTCPACRCDLTCPALPPGETAPPGTVSVTPGTLYAPPPAPPEAPPPPPPPGCPAPLTVKPPCDFESVQLAYPEWVQGELSKGASPEAILQTAQNCGLCVTITPPPSTAPLKPPGPPSQRAGCPTIPGPMQLGQQSVAACLGQGPSYLLSIVFGIENVLKRACANAPGSLSDLLGQLARSAGEVRIVGGFLQGLLASGQRLLQCLACNALPIEQWVAVLLDCPDAPIAGVMLVELLAGIWERWVGEIPPKIKEAAQQFEDFLCPHGLPTIDEATAAWLASGITEEMWECLVRAEGGRPTIHRLIRDAQREKPSFLDALSLYRRKRISESEYLDLVRRNGITTEADRVQMEAAAEWVPSPTDAINWMLKDVDDPQIQNTFGLGREFSLKYQGKTKAALDANGVSAQDAENLWRAHWRNMAPTTLYEMHKRLRPGWTALMSDADAITLATAILPRRPQGPGAQAEMEANPRTWLEDILSLPPASQGAAAKKYLESLQTSGFHLFEALGQADYPPFWRDRLMAISYNVLTRVDIRRAYETNQMDQTTLISRLQDRGYTPNDATMLGGFYREAAVQLASRRPAANQWVTTGYDAELLRQTLIDSGMRPDMWPDVFRRLQVRRQIYIQTRCLAQWKREFVRRLYTDTEMYTRLLGLGLKHEQAQQLIQEWSCERKATHRQVMASQLCRQMRQGVINSVAFASGLRDLGYRPRDIRRMLASCAAATPLPRKAVPLSPPNPYVAPEET